MYTIHLGFNYAMSNGHLERYNIITGVSLDMENPVFQGQSNGYTRANYVGGKRTFPKLGDHIRT